MSQEDLCEREPHAILEGATHRVTSPSSKLRAESAQRILSAPTVALLIFLVIGMLLPLYYVGQPRDTQDQRQSAFELTPTMSELHSLTWNNSGRLEQVKVVETCVSKHKCEDLSRILGQPDSHLTPPVKQIPLSCCRAVFQRWLIWGSKPKEAYPINWKGLINALRDIELESDSKYLEKALHLRIWNMG